MPHDEEQFVVPYFHSTQPLMCDSCDFMKNLGLRVLRKRVLTKSEPIGFVCLDCIARMWNAPDSGPHEPSAEQRKEGEQVQGIEEGTDYDDET